MQVDAMKKLYRYIRLMERKSFAGGNAGSQGAGLWVRVF